MRWRNGAPPQLYAVVNGATGHVLAFERVEQRKQFLESPHLVRGQWALFTYVQKEAKRVAPRRRG